MISSLQLARLCGLSQGTVDRALHDRPGISAKTRARVLAMAERHGYRPHPAVRELLTGERRTIGAIIPAANSIFFMDLLNTIREALAPDGYRMVMTQVDDEAAFVDALGEFAASRARMVVAVAPSPMMLPPALTRAVDVAALINPCRGARVKNLMPDEVRTGRTATRYLLARGHRRIAHLAPARDTPAIADRARGYASALAARSLPRRIVRPADGEAIVSAVRQWGATALFCHNDWLALSAIRMLNQAGLRVPEDVSVLGVDDSPTFVSLCPQITTLHYPAESIAQAIRAWLAGKPLPRIEPARLVERQTVAAR